METISCSCLPSHNVCRVCVCTHVVHVCILVRVGGDGNSQPEKGFKVNWQIVIHLLEMLLYQKISKPGAANMSCEGHVLVY